jgi:hypothetical protein
MLFANMFAETKKKDGRIKQMKKVICIISIFILLLCSGTSLHATKNKQSSWNNNDWNKFPKQNWSGNSSWKDFFSWGNSSWKNYNGYGYGHRGTKPPGCNTPEPISSALFVLGGAGLGIYRKFKSKD